MLIDMHVHTARNDGPLRPDGGRYPTPEELLAMMNERGISVASVMCGVSPECRYRFVTTEHVLEICREHPDRLVPFAGLDPRMGNNSPKTDFGPVLTHYKTMGCRGVGEYVPNLPLDHPLNMNLFAQVSEAGLPLTFHLATRRGGCYGCIDQHGLPRLERVLEAFPGLALLGHSQPFWSEISADVTPDNRGGYPTGPVRPGRVVQLMRRYPNLYGDLSAHSGYNAITRDHEFGCDFLEEFQDRLLFGTDIAHTEQDTPIVGFFETIREEKKISPVAWEKIASGNAARLLRLPEPYVA
jgi:predicted TIM-barrel fold metal-dependent hydrolase